VNYQIIYDNIIKKAKRELRTKGGNTYYEKHHIKPKCLGGDDTDDNLVLLTAREHFICHRLLYKLNPDNLKIISAFWGMCNQRKQERKKDYTPSSRAYQEAREAFSKAQREAKLGIKNPMFGKDGPMKNKHHTIETRKIMSMKKIGVQSPRKGKPGRRLTIDEKKHLSSIHIGKILSEETKKKMSKPKEKTMCPYCKLVGGVGSLKRYHFDNCSTYTGVKHKKPARQQLKAVTQ